MTDVYQGPTIAGLLRRERALSDRIEGVIKRTYPVGAEVIYSTFTYTIRCLVLAHHYGGMVLILNEATGKRRKVDGRSADLQITQDSAHALSAAPGLQIELVAEEERREA